MRNRIIKEGFFRSYELAQLPPLARILFQGLWCMADKDGRLWDRPQQIKIECLPYDDCDVNELLGMLTTAGFILRYEAEKRACIQVVNFGKHQPLTNWEKTKSTSEIPPPKPARTTSAQLQKLKRSTTEALQQDFSSTSDSIISVREESGRETEVLQFRNEETHTRQPTPNGSKPLSIYLEIFGQQTNLHNQNLIETEVTDLDCWRRVLTRLQANGIPAGKVGTFVDAYRDEVKKQRRASPASPEMPSFGASALEKFMREEEEARHAGKTTAEQR